ncbi:MAG: TonB-dependent receptor [Siphonobacter sp.]
MSKCYVLFLCLFISLIANAQTGRIVGTVTSEAGSVSFANVVIPKLNIGTTSDEFGQFTLINIPLGRYQIQVTSIGHEPFKTDVTVSGTSDNTLTIRLKSTSVALNEVIVTGVSKATAIKENPVPVALISARQIERASESNLIDALVKNVPGLTAVKTGPNISKPFIRGLGYNRVLTLYDGVRQEGQQWGDEHGVEVDAYNIERAEVIKGPSSLMYGSDAVAGVVSLLPVMPVNTDGKITGKFFTEYQSNNGMIGNGLRLIYGNGHWDFALRGSYRMAKNYTNSIDGRVYNTGFKEKNLAASLKYTGSTGYSTFNLTLYDNLQGIPDGSRDSLTRAFTKQIYEADKDVVTARPMVSQQELNSYTLSPLHQHIQHYRIYTTNHYDLNKGDLDVLLAFQQNIRREYNHPTVPTQAGMYVRLNTLNYGLRYNLPTFLNTDVSVGVNGMYQDNKNKDATDFPIPDYNLVDVGGYVFGKWKKDKWTISGGFRYDRRKLTGDDFYTRINPETGFDQQVSLPDTAGAYQQFASINKVFTGTSLSLGATYQLNELISIKANVAKGYRAPSITEFASNGLDPGAHVVYLGNRNFNPEFSYQEDLGIEMQNKSVLLSLNVFNNFLKNYIYLARLTDENGNSILDAQGNKTYQYLQSKAQLYGLEITVNWHPVSVKGFSFDNSFSIVHGYNRENRYKGKGVEGEYLPLIPPVKVMSSIGQDIGVRSELFSSIKLRLEADINAAQNRYLALNNTETKTAGYVLFNFSAGTDIKYYKNNTIQVQVQANNLFDKAYQSNLSRLKYFEYYTSSPNGHLGIYNMGRSFNVKAILSF